MASVSERTWFITGGARGLGAALARAVLSAGGRVAVTTRDLRAASVVAGDRAIGIELDLMRPETFEPALDAAKAALGPIDVLVNNAGYGLLGAVEETTNDEARALMEANFFGPTTLTKMLLPTFRKRGCGAIVVMSSVSAVTSPAGSGYYAASKHAIEGWSDSLREELRPFGVHVLVVEPGTFRTGFHRSRRHTLQQLSVYAAVDDRRAADRIYGDTAPGDPDLAARVVVAALDADEPPARLVLGGSASGIVSTALEERLVELGRWRGVATAVDFLDERKQPGTDAH